MPYTTYERVQIILARNIGESGGTGAALAKETIDQNILEADQEIDAKLVSVYSVPFNPVPELIVKISTAIAAYLSDLTFREVRDYQSEMNPVVLRYKRAQELLKQLASGQMDLPGATPATGQAGGGQIVAAFNANGEALFCDQDFDLRCYQPVNRTGRQFPASEFWGLW